MGIYLLSLYDQCAKQVPTFKDNLHCCNFGKRLYYSSEKQPSRIASFNPPNYFSTRYSTSRSVFKSIDYRIQMNGFSVFQGDYLKIYSLDWVPGIRSSICCVCVCIFFIHPILCFMLHFWDSQTNLILNVFLLCET